MVDDCILDKALDKMKEIIGIEKINDTMILINMDDERPDDITLKKLLY